MDLRLRACTDLSSVDPAAWDALDHGDSPFLEFGFLLALERSGSIGEDSGWAPLYLLAEAVPDANPPEGTTGGDAAPSLVGAIACFLKSHSYGEYIFDWGWARASARAGIPYYPKLVVAAPVTPATGPRILLRRPGDEAGCDRQAVIAALLAGVRRLADDLEVSSIHWLFTTAEEHALLTEAGFMPRLSFQFHWRNRDYESFDAFLGTLSSRKRKQIRKERRRALEAVDGVEFVRAPDLEPRAIAQLDRFYRTTTFRHGGQDYLRPGFFEALARSLPDRFLLARARRKGDTVAGALYLETEGTLFGRYWGCSEEIEFLHFEVAYYAGIERCIERGLSVFEAGAQGEHKLLRGFAPAPTYSSHWIRHPELRRAVQRFLREEAVAVPDYMRELEQFTPFKRGEDPTSGSADD